MSIEPPLTLREEIAWLREKIAYLRANVERDLEDIAAGREFREDPPMPPTFWDLRSAVIAAQQRTKSREQLRQVMIEYGGQRAKSDVTEGPSLMAIPKAHYGEVIAAISALE